MKRWLRAALTSAFVLVVPAFAGPLVVVEAPASLAGEAAQVRGFPATTLQPVLHLVGLEGPGEAGPRSPSSWLRRIRRKRARRRRG